MVEVDDENSPGKLFRGKIPDPDGAISQNHLDGRPCPTPLVGYAVDAARKFLGGFNGAGVGGGRWIANGAVFLVDADGSEYAAQFDFPRVGGLALHFADTALSLPPDYRNPCAVDFHVDDGDRRTEWNRPIELETALDLGVFAYFAGDFLLDGFESFFSCTDRGSGSEGRI